MVLSLKFCALRVDQFLASFGVQIFELKKYITIQSVCRIFCQTHLHFLRRKYLNMFESIRETYATTALDSNSSIISFSVDSSINDSNTVFNAAAEGNQDALKHFLMKDPSLVMKLCPLSERSLLYLAAQEGHCECVQFLMDQGAKDVDGGCYLAAKNESTKQIIFWHDTRKSRKSIVTEQPSPPVKIFSRFYCCGTVGS